MQDASSPPPNDASFESASTPRDTPAARPLPRPEKDWRQKEQRTNSAGSVLWRRRIFATASATVAAFLIGLIAFAPLASWQTTCISLAIDDYPMGLLAPVPYREQDLRALRDVVAGRCGPAGQRNLIELTNHETSVTAQKPLANFMQNLPLRHKDVVVAYVRGQSFVPALTDSSTISPDSTSPQSGCVLAASDFSPASNRPRGVVACRQLIETLGSARNTTTLVAMDLGNLRWDPRLGVALHLVPQRLERDLQGEAHPRKDRDSGDNWLITSHDTLEFSAVHPGEQRSLFSKAIELALGGSADKTPWGDDDGVVTLDELARFVTATTAAWAQSTSGARHRQHPVVWKVGVGRVPLEKIPQGIELIRVPVPSWQEKTGWLGSWFRSKEADNKTEDSDAASTKNSDATQPLLAPAGRDTPDSDFQAAAPPTPKPELNDQPQAIPNDAVKTEVTLKEKAATNTQSASPPRGAIAEESPDIDTTNAAAAPSNPQKDTKDTIDSKPERQQDKSSPAIAPTKPRKPPPTNPWELLEVQKRRPEKADGAAALSDQSPHLIRMSGHQIAFAERDQLTGGRRAENAKEWLHSFSCAMQQFHRADAAAEKSLSRSPLASLLRAACDAGVSSKTGAAWQEAPAEVRALLAARNDAVEIIAAVIDLNGQLSAGINPVLIDDRIIDACISQIADASTTLQNFSANGNGEAPQLERISSDTLLLLHKVTMLRDFVATAVSTITGSSTKTLPGTCHEIFELLATTAIPPQNRQRLLRLLAFAQAGQAALPPPSFEVSTLQGHRPQTRLITRTIVSQISRLATTEIDLFAASTGYSQVSQTPPVLRPIAEAILEAKAAVSKLTKAVESATQPQIEDLVLQVGATLSELFLRAKTVASSPDFIGDRNLINSDQSAGVLRLLDPRDAISAAAATVITPQHLRQQPHPPLTLELETASSIPVRTSRVAVAYRGDGSALPQGEVVFQFDPALLRVSKNDGTQLPSGTALPAMTLDWRENRATFLVRVIASPGLTVTAGSLLVTVTIRGDGQSSQNSIAIPVSQSGNLLLAARGHPLTVTGPQDDAGWCHANVSSQFTAPGSSPHVASAPTLSLRSWPTGLTRWDIGLENLSGKARSVSVRIYKVPTDNTQVDHSKAWQLATSSILSDPAGSKPLLEAKDVSLTANPGVQLVKLSPPKPETNPPGPPPDKKADDPPADNGRLLLPPPNDEESGEVLLGSDLAVVIEEKTADTSPPKLFRLTLSPIHPRHFVSASGTYDTRRREIQIRLDSSTVTSGPLPPGGITGVLHSMKSPSMIDRAASAPIGVIPRKPVVELTQEKQTGIAAMAWNGSDRGTAILTLDVNGYPRAFIFSIDISPASDGVEQFPQRDWRSIRITEPTETRTFLRASEKSIPMTFEIDAPADAFRNGPNGEDSIEVVLRPIGVGKINSGSETVGWRGFSDRQVRYTMPSKPKDLEVTTTVSDWTVEVSADGFSNLDVRADARLSVAGQQQLAIDARTIVLDGTSPVIEAPPTVAGVVGRSVVIPLRVSDDVSDGFFIAPDRIRPGVSGIKTVRWAIDLEGTGKPKDWTPAVWLGGVRYEVRIDTKKLPTGVRLPVLITATDRVGLADPPTRVWLDLAAEPASPNNILNGRVTLDGRGESGVWVVLNGPSGERRVKSGKGGSFQFTNLEPGNYSVLAQGAVRNTSRRSEVVEVPLAAAPAAPASVALQLK